MYLTLEVARWGNTFYCERGIQSAIKENALRTRGCVHIAVYEAGTII